METYKAGNNPYGSKLFADDSHKDFKILVEDQEFKVHKCMLSVASPVLAVMVNSQMVEGHSGQMSIVDFSSKTIEESLLFMYKGWCTEESCRNAECLAEILNFGHKYDIQELQDYCIEQIERNKACFGQDQRRFFIKNAVKLDSDRILDAVLSVFGSSGTGAFKFNNYLLPSSVFNGNSTLPPISPYIGSSTARSSLAASTMVPSTSILSNGQVVTSSTSVPSSSIRGSTVLPSGQVSYAMFSVPINSYISSSIPGTSIVPSTTILPSGQQVQSSIVVSTSSITNTVASTATGFHIIGTTPPSNEAPSNPQVPDDPIQVNVEESSDDEDEDGPEHYYEESDLEQEIDQIDREIDEQNLEHSEQLAEDSDIEMSISELENSESEPETDLEIEQSEPEEEAPEHEEESETGQEVSEQEEDHENDNSAPEISDAEMKISEYVQEIAGEIDDSEPDEPESTDAEFSDDSSDDSDNW